MEMWPRRTIMIADTTIEAATEVVREVVSDAAQKSSMMRRGYTVIGEPYRLTNDEVCVGVWCFGTDEITPPGRVLVMPTLVMEEDAIQVRLSAASSPVGPHTILGGRDVTPPQLALTLDECVKELLTHFEVE